MITIYLKSSFIKLSSSTPSNLFDDCKDINDLILAYMLSLMN
jgi:hypothetical protein